MIEYYKNLDLADIVYTNEFGMKCTEIWKDIPEYENYFQASNLGRVKALDRIVNCNGGKMLRKSRMRPCYLLKNKYLNTGLTKLGKPKTYLTHRLIALAFNSNPLNLPEVNHWDGNKLNILPYNLVWSTVPDNRQHAFDTGLKFPSSGEKCGMSKLKEHQFWKSELLEKI